ncbi:Der GTPase-activating protein YihI [Photobacterium chitinilyticum]|uniref:Der GTPase-activating protein YihI n=1 Tax=Photobacterium chitinilyticum TaxID=2485123 RepID=A0A3S3UGQ4_9GAMM|nr:Der GTPase-activating protein YihI [Photobacterium chitinilyticum]RWX53559.1 GTPase-activating protein [Photobacterium chitinilyticum]
MTRKKRTRTPGSEGPAEYSQKSTTRADLEARKRQKDKKRKGLKSGSRHSAVQTEDARAQAKRKDPRHGSKKPVALIVEAKKPTTKKERRLSAEQELAMLENDAQLMVLLDRIEAGENLGAGLQKQVDQKLDRIEQLMNQLGLLEDNVPEAADGFAPVAGISSDDDLLEQFENSDFGSFENPFEDSGESSSDKE